METSFANFCRACLGQTTLFESIFASAECSNASISFADIINSSISSSVHISKNDGLPDKICPLCSQQLREIHKFKLNLEKSDIILKSQLLNIGNDMNISQEHWVKEEQLDLDSGFQEQYENYDGIENDFRDSKGEIVIKQETLDQEMIDEDLLEKDISKLNNDKSNFLSGIIKDEVISEENMNYDINFDETINSKNADDNDINNIDNDYNVDKLKYKEKAKNDFSEDDNASENNFGGCFEEIVEDDLSPGQKKVIVLLPSKEEVGSSASLNLVPEKSKTQYHLAYKEFMDWKRTKNLNSFSEDMLLEYFEDLSQKYNSSSLWVKFYMLNSTLKINDNIILKKYSKLLAFLKRKAEGHKPKKGKVFSHDEINKFIKEAPNSIYLLTKVALIMGIMGGCRAKELNAINFKDIQDLGSVLLVTVHNNKTNTIRNFTITGSFYRICKKYIDLRPANVTTNSFFLNYRNGECRTQKIGINKFGPMGKEIAKFLKLPNPELYSGHGFRKSSVNIFVES